MNPFLSETSITILIKKRIVNNSTEIEDGVNKICETRINYTYIDTQEFTKCFKSSSILKIIQKLKPVSCKLFLYIQQTLIKNMDYIDLPRESLSKILNVSNATVGLAVQDLKDWGIIARKGRSDYWINPKFLFVGDRKDFFYKNAPSELPTHSRADGMGFKDQRSN